MNFEQMAVREFDSIKEPWGTREFIPGRNLDNPEEAALRIALIAEEFNELIQGVANQDRVAVADALADLLYVTYGAAETFGIDIEPVFKEVHRSNMTKFPLCQSCEGVNSQDCEICKGYPRIVSYRDDGKILKPNSYSPPNIKEILDAQENSNRHQDNQGTVNGGVIVRLDAASVSSDEAGAD